MKHSSMGGEHEEEVILRVSPEKFEPEHCDGKFITDAFLAGFLKHRPRLSAAHADGRLVIDFNITPPGALEFYRINGRKNVLLIEDKGAWGKGFLFRPAQEHIGESF
ncbi:MAG: hypothetical protein ABFC24_02490 [Methanoregulaceae archaeon]